MYLVLDPPPAGVERMDKATSRQEGGEESRSSNRGTEMRAPEVGGGSLDPVRTCTGKRPSAAARGRPSSVTRPGERAGQHHGRGVGRLRGQQLPPPDLRLRAGGTDLSAPCPPPPGARRPRWRLRGLSLQRATASIVQMSGRRAGVEGGAEAGRRGKEREGGEGLQVDSNKNGGYFCKNAEEHVATCGSKWSRKTRTCGSKRSRKHGRASRTKWDEQSGGAKVGLARAMRPP